MYSASIVEQIDVDATAYPSYIPPMKEFTRFVNWAGSPLEAAVLLECSLVLVYKMLSGERGVSKATAQKIDKVSRGRFSIRKLLYGVAA